MSNLQYIPVDLIQTGERTRKEFGELEEMCSSIKDIGLISPIAVKPTPGNYTYMLIAGERRLTCYKRLLESTKEAKYQTIPAKIFQSDMTDIELHEAELAENMIRKDMTWSEDIALKEKIHKMMVDKYGQRVGKTEDAAGWDATRTAKILNTSTSSISRDLQLANAVGKFPDLAKAKNKSEAMKIISKAHTIRIHSDMAKKMDLINEGSSQEMLLKKKLADSYILSDCFPKIENLPDGYFDLVEVDPPYGIDFQTQDRKPGRAIESVNYNEIPAEEYEEFIRKILTLIHRKVKADGWVIFWHSMYPWWTVINEMAKQIGFTSANFPAIWVKTAASNMNPVHNLAKNYEAFLYLRRGPAKLAKAGALSTFITEPLRGDRIHPTERPIALMEQVISTFIMPGSNKKVLVPFAGSGNTLLACCNLGLTPVGYDLTKEYQEGFVSRVMTGRYAQYSSKKSIELPEVVDE